MGYTTTFRGRFNLNKQLTPEHAAYLAAFCAKRRMKRDPAKAASLPDPVRLAVSLPIGQEGGYFTGSLDEHGQDEDASLVNFNTPPAGQPGLWCQWRPTEDRLGIEWDEGEAFSDYREWLWYLIEHFLGPWGYVLNGSVEYEGEDREDVGTLAVVDNVPM